MQAFTFENPQALDKVKNKVLHYAKRKKDPEISLLYLKFKLRVLDIWGVIHWCIILPTWQLLIYVLLLNSYKILLSSCVFYTSKLRHIKTKKGGKFYVNIGGHLDATLYLHHHIAFPIPLFWSLTNQSEAANITCYTKGYIETHEEK